MTYCNGRFAGLKAIVFDFDGVILESADIKTQAFLDLFADYPEHQEAILAHHLEHLNVSRYHKFAWIYGELLRQPYTEAERQRLGDAFSALVLERILACPFVPGAREALEALEHRLSLFLASGTPQEELELVVARRRLAGHFQEMWGTPREKPDIIADILQRFELRKDEVVMVGDGLTDYAAAASVGIPFVARRTPEAQHWHGVDVPCVADLWELQDLISASQGQRPGLAQTLPAIDTLA